MNRYFCSSPCEWEKDGFCLRNPCPNGSLRIVLDKKSSNYDKKIKRTFRRNINDLKRFKAPRERKPQNGQL